MKRSLSSPLAFCTTALFLGAISSGWGATLPAQTPTGTAADANKRRQLDEKGFQDKINDVFGELLQITAFVPFYNIAPWLGMSTDSHLRRNEQGDPKLAAVTLAGHAGAVVGAELSPQDDRVLTIGSDRSARLWSMRGKLLATLEAPAAITASAFFPDGNEVVLGCSNGSAVVWNIAPKKVDGEQVITPVQVASLDGHTGGVVSIAYSSDGARLVTAGADHVCRLWDAHCNATATLTGHTASVTGLAFDPAGELLLTTADDGTARLWDTSGKAVATLDGHTGGVRAAAWAADGTHLLTSAAGDADIRIWKRDGGSAGRVAASGADSAAAAGFGADGTTLAVPSSTTERALYDLSGAAAGTEPVTPAAWSLQTTAAGPAILDAEGKTLHALAGHTGRVTTAFLSADGSRAITTSEDGTARIWEWMVRDPTGALVSTSVPFVVLWLVVASVLFTLYMKFANFRFFGHAIAVVAGKYDDPSDEGEVTHFQALSSALSGTVGLGNIAGVAIAIMVGGPGATVWMIVAGLLGMTLKFTECTLGQRYRQIASDGSVSGGPMHYLQEGLAKRGLAPIGTVLAGVFILFCVGGSLAGGNSFQVNQSLTILKERVPFFEDNGWIYGVIMAVMVGIVIIGGIKRIAQTAEKIVPTMCGIYLLASLTILVFNIDAVPAAFGAILSGAFTGDAVYGGALGALIMGFRRAAFSNEAGVGSASIAHSAARTPYPVREGIVALLEPFIDTVIVCTMTALVINITGVHTMAEHADLVASKAGAALTSEAFQTVSFLESWFPWVLMGAVVLFAFSTMITWSYYGERCWTHVFGPKSSMLYKLLFLVFVVLGSVVTAHNMLEFGDLMILLMAFPNIIGLYFLGGEVKQELTEYEADLRSGKITTFK